MKIASILSGILFLSILNAVTTMALALFYIEEVSGLVNAREHVTCSFVLDKQPG